MGSIGQTDSNGLAAPASNKHAGVVQGMVTRKGCAIDDTPLTALLVSVEEVDGGLEATLIRRQRQYILEVSREARVLHKTTRQRYGVGARCCCSESGKSCPPEFAAPVGSAEFSQQVCEPAGLARNGETALVAVPGLAVGAEASCWYHACTVSRIDVEAQVELPGRGLQSTVDDQRLKPSLNLRPGGVMVALHPAAHGLAARR